MAESSITREGKIQKLKKDDEVNISNLHQTILAHILSFLSIKDAVKTSVLSKTWKSLWTSIPSLIFDEHELSDSQRGLFKDSVDKVLLLHGPLPIKVFSLRSESLGNEDRIRFDGWISNVVRHNVEGCSLDLGTAEGSEIFWLPHSLLTCDTLVKLNLGFMSTTTLFLPSRIHLPNLKVLLLNNTRFTDGSSIQQLFSGPALEILRMKHCNLEKVSAVCISAPKLKHLAIVEQVQNPLNENGEELPDGEEDLPLDRCQVMICDCNLDYFHLSGCIINEYSTTNLSAIHVNLSFEYDTTYQATHRLNKILYGICAVQKLNIDQMTVELFVDTPKRMFDWSDFPSFNALNTLHLDNLSDEIDVLGKILQYTPHLQTLIVDEGIHYPDHEDDEIFDPVPPCFSSSLKKIILGGLFCNRRELYVLKTMLMHTMVLEEFVISLDIGKDDGRLEYFSGQLMRYPRGSRNCKIILESWLLNNQVKEL